MSPCLSTVYSILPNEGQTKHPTRAIHSRRAGLLYSEMVSNLSMPTDARHYKILASEHDRLSIRAISVAVSVREQMHAT